MIALMGFYHQILVGNTNEPGDDWEISGPSDICIQSDVGQEKATYSTDIKETTWKSSTGESGKGPSFEVTFNKKGTYLIEAIVGETKKSKDIQVKLNDVKGCIPGQPKVGRRALEGSFPARLHHVEELPGNRGRVIIYGVVYITNIVGVESTVKIGEREASLCGKGLKKSLSLGGGSIGFSASLPFKFFSISVGGSIPFPGNTYTIFNTPDTKDERYYGQAYEIITRPTSATASGRVIKEIIHGKQTRSLVIYYYKEQI
ncbi:MAG: hypothetical protein NZM04_04090 [Methylacidiphilales bacterium]|nr:hypothetical protein [Candidatus Methylacidiphilales bacterium]